MLFSSLEFLFLFLPIVFALYFSLFRIRYLSNLVLLILSLVFYAYGEPKYIWVLIGSILFNTIFAALLCKTPDGSIRRSLFLFALVCNLLPLFIFKYFGFLMQSFGLNSAPALQLPIGISFFTFQAISYITDVFRHKSSFAGVGKTGLYLSFFPQLIAGPILKYEDVSDQIESRKESFAGFCDGIFRFSVGFCKKVLLANSFGAISDKVFNWSAIGADYYPVPAALAWLGSISYSLQIYYDFSGYSDMAIGLGACFGFHFPENFRYPYAATSIRDFWSRWHISLTNWFREYVYIPLGGNRNESMDKTVRNLFIVWLLTGIWHGANWTFLFWGIYYFCFQVFERLTGFPGRQLSKTVKRLYTLLAVNFGWVIFRAQDLFQAGVYFRNMLGLNYNGFESPLAWFLLKENIVYFLFGILLLFPLDRMRTMFPKPSIARSAVGVGLFFAMWLSISFLVSGSYNPFIYFDF